MSLRENDSLSALLTRMNLVVSGAALLMAGLAFFSYDLLSLRHALIRDLAAEAQIIGDNTVSALTLNDKKSAAITLNDLRRSPDVLAAALDSSNGPRSHYIELPIRARRHRICYPFARPIISGHLERTSYWRIVLFPTGSPSVPYTSPPGSPRSVNELASAFSSSV